MQLTIISDKLAGLTVDEFKHEFCTVHAEDTKEAASSLGLISQYIQGLYLPSAIDGAKPLTSLPLPEHDGPYQSLAQLSWPSITVLQGSLQSAEYKASATAKHNFAVPKHIFMTERLEPDTSHESGVPGRPGHISAEWRPVVLIAALTPGSGLSEAEFRERWAKHGDSVRALAVAHYQRNAIIPAPREQIYATFTETQFPADRCWDRGGYEELVFANIGDAQSFCSQHGEALRASYEGFCDMQRSWCAGFDYIERWGRVDIGLKQRVVGTILGGMLGAKTIFGL
ncbi:hypothetical protein N0V93_000082 [Gnomoniopsis smithogilvyi]|uniref:EthD domain-containing protein n=1 Tax=Gnomoniopsis smithogilvyi TaxID=1191159 RepID=A0A9W9D0E9_9PEZI|nr:hypothetical protein N0V93_000082 [Gnomoniopsis smithogilvyi]